MLTSEPAAWVCILPSAIFDSLPIIPTISTRSTPRRAQCFSAAPTKSPIWMNASSAISGCSFIAYASDLPPVVTTSVRWPRSRATSMAWTTLARKAAVEYGFTIPVVPRIEIPPIRPRRAFSVCLAISSPPGTVSVTSAPRAGAPGRELLLHHLGDVLARHRVHRGRADLQPQPRLGDRRDARRRRGSRRRLARQLDRRHQLGAVRAVGVVAGVLDDAAGGARRRPARSASSGNVTRMRLGNVVSISASIEPRTSARVAALAAAAAQAPVVKPVRSFFLSSAVGLSVGLGMAFVRGRRRRRDRERTSPR